MNINDKKDKLEKIINKAKILGLKTYMIDTIYGNCVLLPSVSNADILYIPDNIKEMKSRHGDIILKSYGINTEDHVLEVVGGSGLKTTSSLFNQMKVSKLDLSCMDAHNITDMQGMFCFSDIGTIDFGSIDTSSVTNMKSMFAYSRIDRLDISKLNTHNVTDMSCMFLQSKVVEELIINGIDTSSVTNMERMFKNCYIGNKFLNLGSFDTSKVRTMSGMFCECRAEKLNVSSFDTRNVMYMEDMFMGTDMDELDLSSFKTPNVINMDRMFFHCRAKNIDMSNFTHESLQRYINMFKKPNRRFIPNVKINDPVLLDWYKKF